MEDVIYLIIMAVLMIGGVISSSNKKKKAREAAARKMGQQPAGEVPAEKKVVVRKSLSEILEELARDNTQQAPESYYEEETIGSDYDFEDMVPVKEGGRVTKEPMVNYASEPRIAATATLLEEDSLPEENNRKLNDILGGEFDLRRAVIESEILAPRFEKY